MTKKRFHKLYYSEMAKLMAGNEKAGQVLKSVRVCVPVWDKIPGGPSYQNAWDMVRTIFVDMDYNRGVDVPRK